MLTFLFIVFLFFIIIYILNNTEIAQAYPVPGPSPDTVMKGGGPFEMTAGNKEAAMLIHGYGGTPKEMRELGELLHKKKYDIFAPLLPGHSVNEHHLAKSRFADWYREARRVYLEQRSKYKKFYLIGLSMGGSQVLKLTEEFSGTPLEPTAIVAIAAPVFLNAFIDGKFVIRDYRLFISGIIGRLVPLVQRKPISKEEKEAVPWLGYTKHQATAAVHSLKYNLKFVKKDLKKIKVPILIMHSKLDESVMYENSPYIYTHVSSDVREFHTIEFDKGDKTEQHVMIQHKNMKERIFNYIFDFLKKY
ncbi:alpha/beta hydrolase [Spirochaetota bacterium]